MEFLIKHLNIINFKNNKQIGGTGFVLPFAVLVSGILLAIGLSIFSITMKELLISSSGRESQFAFYAADTGGECALYWDVRHDGFPISVFATSSDSVNNSLVPTKNGGSSVFCNKENITSEITGWNSTKGWDITHESNGATTEFDIKFDNGSCATVYVYKGAHTLDGGEGTTQIDSHGFNTCDSNNPRRVERGMRIRY